MPATASSSLQMYGKPVALHGRHLIMCMSVLFLLKHVACRVMVLDAGRLVEFESPAALMQLPGGQFRSLVEEASR